MNSQVNAKVVLTELRSTIGSMGHPPTDDFTKLCHYVTKWMLRRYELQYDDDINHGYCFIWTYLVWALWPEDGITFKVTTGHVIIK